MFFERVHNRHIREDVIHVAMAFGGGILIAAVSFVLVPRAISSLSVAELIIIFVAGAISFMFLDRRLAKSGDRVSQLLAMMMDYIPEAIALGAVFSMDMNLGLLLALYIGLQNLPESFNAYQDMRASGLSGRKTLLIFLPLSLSGVAAAVSGRYLLSAHPGLLAAFMLFSASGIIYFMFQDIAPSSKVKNHWFPALGASLGFLVGALGKKLLG